MLGIDFNAFSLLRWARPGVRWLEPSFPASLAILAIVLAHYVRDTSLFTAITKGVPYGTLASYAIYLLAPLGFIACWFLGVFVYLRSGHGPKLGLVYEAFDVEEPHVQKVKEILRELHKGGEMRRITSLRFLPRRAIANSKSKDRYIRRFNFSIIARVGQTKTIKSNRPLFNVDIYMKSKTADAQVVNKMIHGFLARYQARKTKPLSVLDLLEKSAVDLSDLMLTLLAVQKLLNKELADAAALLRRIEDTTPDSLDKATPPRVTIRKLDAFARLHPLNFLASSMPEPDDLPDMLERAETASRYATQFTWAASIIARLRFFTGDCEGALRIINECLQYNRGARRDPLILLAKAFLEFYSSRWCTASDCYSGLLDNPNLFALQWRDDLVPFANYVAGIGTEGAPVLQTLYSSLANCGVTSQVEADALKWIQADASRSGFRELLQRAPEVWSAHHSKNAQSRSNPSGTEPSRKAKRPKKTGRKRRKRRR